MRKTSDDEGAVCKNYVKDFLKFDIFVVKIQGCSSLLIILNHNIFLSSYDIIHIQSSSSSSFKISIV